MKWDSVYDPWRHYNTDIDCMNINAVIIEYMDGGLSIYGGEEILPLIVPYELIYNYGSIFEFEGKVYREMYGRYRAERCCNFK